MDTAGVIIFGIIVISILVLVVIAAYYFTTITEQAVTIESNLDQTFRHIRTGAHLDDRLPVETIRVKVLGSFDDNGDRFRQLISEHILDPYRKGILVHEPELFSLNEEILQTDVPTVRLRRIPVSTPPTLENLCIMYFNRLSTVLPSIGGHIVSVKLKSGDIRASYYRQ